MIIAKDEIIYDDQEQKKEKEEAETAKHKNDSEINKVFDEMKDYTEKYYKEI